VTQVVKAWADKSRVELQSGRSVRSVPPPSMSRLGLRLTPHGHLLLEQADDAADLKAGSAARLVDAFARGSGPGLVQLGAGEVGQALPPVLAWWRGFAARYVTSLCLHAPGSGEDASPPSALADVAAPGTAELSTLVLTAPIMPGSEYLTPDLLQALWAEMGTAAFTAFAAAKTDLQSFLTRIIHRTARNRPRPPNTWARDFIAKNSIKQPIRIVVNDIKGLALTVHFS